MDGGNRDTSEAVKVVVRCRPMNTREKEMKCNKCVEIEPSVGKITIMKEDESPDLAKAFTYDAVFDTDSHQQDLYQETAMPLVESVLSGYNGTIFAYGQTGCGKSFSMMGVPADPDLMGIIPRAFHQIFAAMATNSVANKQFLIQASYIEIYNEEVRDLLSSNPTNRLELKEHPEKGVYIQGVLKNTVKSIGEITKLMDQGAANRSVGATLMNADSSRSHSIFMLEIETSEPVPDGAPGDVTIRQGVLNLVDLAGSERQAKTGAAGQRLKEAAKINLSLSALGNVISALVAGKPHIPYRDSKLTRLLQNSLGGNAKTVMIAAISPAHYNYEETLSTLRYANRAKNIKNKPKVNEDPRDALLREYQDEIKRLKELLQTGGGGGSAGGVGLVKGTPEWEAALEAEKKRMIAEAQEDMKRLQREKEASVSEAERLRNMLASEREAQADRLRALEEAAMAVDEETRRRKLAIAKRMAKSGTKGVSGNRRKTPRPDSTVVDAEGSIDLDGQTVPETQSEGGDGGEQVSEEGDMDEIPDYTFSPEDDEQLAADRAAIQNAIEEERAKQAELEERWERAEEDVRVINQQQDERGEERDKRIHELQERLQRLQSEATARVELEKRLAEMQQQLIEGGQRTKDVNDQMTKAQETIQKLMEQQRAAKLARAKQSATLQKIEAQALTELQVKNGLIRDLQRQNAQLQQETQDLQTEFESERQDYVNSIQELSREVQLYKQIAKTVFKPGDMELILRTARYDETRNVWNLSHITMPVVLPVISPSVNSGMPGDSLQDSTLARLQAHRQQQLAQTYRSGANPPRGMGLLNSGGLARPVSGPGLAINQAAAAKPKSVISEIISTAGPYSPGVASPTPFGPYVPNPPDSARASRSSSRGGPRPNGALPDHYSSMGTTRGISTPPATIAQPQRSVEELQNELETVRSRPGFVPQVARSSGPTSSSPVTSHQDVIAATDRLEAAVGYRPGFAPAAPSNASSSSLGSTSGPLSARTQQLPSNDMSSLDELSRIQRRPGFNRPAMDASGDARLSASLPPNAGLGANTALLDSLSSTMVRRPGFQPTR